ncbi:MULTISPECIES: IPTL-CTERM sorting domain-containing protein [unclassified Brevundimonas]|uniref:IPTL-CTERM sorting domain-containing protein n=1 Tax=unclassified Brevundimonas TaxID=2622653 RepID=UPI0011B0BC34|nr:MULTISPECIES: IPTL-CTERM sorting domain-containing protein [unclassified Brevundimonas]
MRRAALTLVGLFVLLVGTTAGGGLANAQACNAGSISFSAVATAQTLNAQACDELINDFGSWGGFFTDATGDAYSFFGLGVDDFGAPADETFETANAVYSFNGVLSTDLFTITLVSLKNGAVANDVISLFMCPGPEVAQACLTTQSTTISVNLPAPLNITTTTLSNASAGAVYSASVLASGGVTPRTFAVTTGALPAGVTLGANGVFAGAPTAVGTFDFTVTVTDNSSATDSQALSLTVDDPTLQVTTPSLAAGTVGVAYSQTIAGTGGTAPRAFAVTTGALPGGLSLSSGGVLAGTPTAGGAFEITVTMTDATTGGAAPFTAARNYTLTIGAPTIAVSPASLASATVASAYSATVTASGGVAGYTFAITAGSLPPGLNLSAGGGLTGTPTAGGSFNFTVTATDSATGATRYTGSRSYGLTVGAPNLLLDTTPLPSTSVGAAYSASVTATGGTLPYVYTIASGDLPTGVTLSSAGVISGTPGASGTFNVTIKVRDSSTGTGPYEASHAYTLTVTPPTLSVSGFLGGASLYASYSGSVSANGGQGPYSYVVSNGSTPPGITLAADGAFSGTPTTTGSFTFSVTATDSTAGNVGGPYTGSDTFTIVVAAPIIVLPGASLSDAILHQSYSQQLPGASGGLAPYSYIFTGGALPLGMSLSSTGLLSGTPTLDGDYTFTVEVRDSSPTPYSGAQTYTVRVVDRPPLVIPTLSEWAMILLAALLGAGAVTTLNRRRTSR